MATTQAAELPLTTDAVTAGQILGFGRSATYKLIADGKFPVRVLSIGRKKRVSRADLLAYLGETPIASNGVNA